MFLDEEYFDCNDLGPNTVVLFVYDSAGNFSTCNTNEIVENNIAPVVVCQDITVQLDATGNATITPAMIDNGSTDNCSTPTLSLDITSFTCANLGVNTVTLTANDGNGNSSTCTADVTVEDNVAPVAICQNITIQLDAAGDATITPADINNGSTDNCTSIADLTYALDITSFTCANIGNNTVTLTVTDAIGNASTCTAEVTVEDNTNPTATCQAFTAYLDASGNATITAADVDNGSADACGGAVSLSIDVSTFTCANLGANTVVLTATDVNGNSSSCNATVTVEDNVDPVAICQNFTVQLDAAGDATITTADIDNGSFDNCGTMTLSLSQTVFDCSHVGNNTVTLTADDGNGNTSTCTAIVTVEDTTAPVVNCQAITIALDINGNASILVSDVHLGSSDICGIQSLYHLILLS